MAQGERSVETLAERTGLSIANASHHLQQMRRAGLIEARRYGKFVYYRMTDDAVLDLLASLARIGERHRRSIGSSAATSTIATAWSQFPEQSCSRG